MVPVFKNFAVYQVILYIYDTGADIYSILVAFKMSNVSLCVIIVCRSAAKPWEVFGILSILSITMYLSVKTQLIVLENCFLIFCANRHLDGFGGNMI